MDGKLQTWRQPLNQTEAAAAHLQGTLAPHAMSLQALGPPGG